MLEMARTTKPCHASRLREASCGPLMASCAFKIRARLRQRMLADAYASLAHAGFRGSRMHMRILVVVRLRVRILVVVRLRAIAGRDPPPLYVRVGRLRSLHEATQCSGYRSCSGSCCNTHVIQTGRMRACKSSYLPSC